MTAVASPTYVFGLWSTTHAHVTPLQRSTKLKISSCLAVFPTHFSQLDLNPANLEATVKAEWILAFLFFWKRNFSVTSQLRHHYVVSCKYWWDILQFFSHTDCQDDSCQNGCKESFSAVFWRRSIDDGEGGAVPDPLVVDNNVGRAGDEWSVVCVELARIVRRTVVVRVTDRWHGAVG